MCHTSPHPRFFGEFQHSSSSGKSDYQKKNLRERLSGSLDASIDFLAYNGVAKSSIAELRAAVSKSLFLPAMRRIQEYVECYVQSLSTVEEKQAAAYMVLQAWMALREYACLVHQRVYAEYNELLVTTHPTKLPNRRDVLRQKLQYMNKVAEYNCGSQAGLLRAQTWESRISHGQ